MWFVLAVVTNGCGVGSGSRPDVETFPGGPGDDEASTHRPPLEDGGGDAVVSSDGSMARADVFETDRDSPLRVDAPGVLANDDLPAPAAAVAMLSTLPAHGTVELAVDGSFVYRPAPGYTGEDSFGYQLVAGTDATPPVLARVTVRPTLRERTLVLLVKHPENAQARPTPAQIADRMDAVNANLEEYSYNRRGLTAVQQQGRSADVRGWYTATNAGCFDLSEFMALAEADAPLDFLAYSRLVVILAPRPGCSLSAWATIGTSSYPTPDGTATYGLVKMSVLNASITTLTHEIGHTFNNGHSRFLDCGPIALGETGCKSVEYGDPYDVMGTGVGHFSARRKELMGLWKGPNRMLDVSTSGTYAIEPIETNTGGVKALKIKRDPFDPIYVEYRQPIGADASFGAAADVYQGALIHRGFDLLNATPPASPYGPTPPTDKELTPALHVGESFVDPAGGVRVTVVARTASLLTVDIAFPPE